MARGTGCKDGPTQARPRGRAKTERSLAQMLGGKGTSVPEIRLRCELGLVFHLPYDKADRVVRTADGKRLDPDILLPSLKIAIEYDSHWHVGREESDMRKVRELRDAGWRVIRLREEPLEKLHDWDVIVPRRASVHALTVAALDQIARMDDRAPVEKFDTYRIGGVALANARVTAEIDKLLGGEALAASEAMLDGLFSGPHHNRDWRKFKDGTLATYSSAELAVRAAVLTDIIGNESWRGQPNLLDRRSEELHEKATALDAIFGERSWRSAPSLLTLNVEELTNRAAVLTEVFGNDEWKKAPSLLGRNPETLRERIVYMVANHGTAWSPNALTGGNVEELEEKLELMRLYRPDFSSAGAYTYNAETMLLKSLMLDGLLGMDDANEMLRGDPTMLRLSETELREKAIVWRANHPVQPFVLASTFDRGDGDGDKLLRVSPVLVRRQRELVTA